MGKKMCLKADIKISSKNNITDASYQRMLTKLFYLILDFSIDNTKFVIKCQAEFLFIDWKLFQNVGYLITNYGMSWETVD